MSQRINNPVRNAVDTPPPTLYHYTDWASLEGIEKGKLWVSHFDSLNDSSEVEYAGTLLLRLAGGNWRRGDSHRRSEIGYPDRLFCAHNATDRGGKLRYACVASLSEEGDLLNQWRAYGDKGRGVSIGLRGSDLAKLCKQGGNSGWRLRRVIYDPAEQINLMCEVIARAPKPTTSGEHGARCRCCMYFEQWLEELPIAFKAPDWREEREWRLVRLSDKPPPRVRPSGRTRVAHFTFPSRAGRVDIEQIVVGPKLGDRRRSALAAVERMVRGRATVRHSQTTLR